MVPWSAFPPAPKNVHVARSCDMPVTRAQRTRLDAAERANNVLATHAAVRSRRRRGRADDVAQVPPDVFAAVLRHLAVREKGKLSGTCRLYYRRVLDGLLHGSLLGSFETLRLTVHDVRVACGGIETSCTVRLSGGARVVRFLRMATHVFESSDPLIAVRVAERRLIGGWGHVDADDLAGQQRVQGHGWVHRDSLNLFEQLDAVHRALVQQHRWARARGRPDRRHAWSGACASRWTAECRRGGAGASTCAAPGSCRSC